MSSVLDWVKTGNGIAHRAQNNISNELFYYQHNILKATATYDINI